MGMKKLLHAIVLMLVLPPFVFAGGQTVECPVDTVIVHRVDTVFIHPPIMKIIEPTTYIRDPGMIDYTGSHWDNLFRGKPINPIFNPTAVDSTTTIDERWKRQAGINQKVAIGLGIALIGTIAFCLLSKTKVTTVVKETPCDDCPY